MNKKKSNDKNPGRTVRPVIPVKRNGGGWGSGGGGPSDERERTVPSALFPRFSSREQKKIGNSDNSHLTEIESILLYQGL